MLFRKDFLFLTKPLYESKFSGKNVEAPDLATVKDFLRFHAATSKGKIQEEATCDSLNTFAEWFFGGFSHVTDTPTNDDDRREIYDVSTSYHLWKASISPSPVGPEVLPRGRPRGPISGGQSIFLLNVMLVACYVPRGRRMIRSLFLSVTGSSFTTLTFHPWYWLPFVSVFKPWL
jgi:hypothetical protein